MAVAPSYVDLSEAIDNKATHCLNETKTNPHTNLFVPDDRITLTSDADEQLLLCVPFNQAVKVFSIRITAPEGETCPTSVKIFANKPSMGFDEAESTAPTQEIELKMSDLVEGIEIPLRFVRFQNINQLYFFFENDSGSETTVISSLSMSGSLIASSAGKLEKC